MSNIIQWALALTVSGCLLLQVDSIQAQQSGLLFRGVVKDGPAVVRSGPGESHYGTDELPVGTQVNVYREDPGGWLAIQPPEGSFSMVQKDQVEVFENGLARVSEDETVAWVGTRLDAVKEPMWQIRLRQGEMLEVLGIVDRAEFELGSQDPDWVQIEPPSGEFRWIAASSIEKLTEGNRGDVVPSSLVAENPGLAQPIQTEVRGVTRQNSNQVPFDSWDEPVVATEWSPVPNANGNSVQPNSVVSQPAVAAPASSATTTANSGWQPARQTITNFVEERSEFVADAANPVGATWTQTGNPDTTLRSNIFDASAGPAASSNPATQPAMLLPPSFGNPVLESIELRLTQEMLKSPEQWNLMPLAAEVERVRATATNPQDVQMVNRILNKIRSCREIQAGFLATNQTGSGIAIPQNVQQITMQDVQQNLLHNYDAHGYLNELVRDGGLGQSTFVLQDVNGRITHHIAPSPGINLRRYLNQRVGIIGNRGYHQQLQLEHVTAERVISLDTLRR